MYSLQLVIHIVSVSRVQPLNLGYAGKRL